MKTHQRDGKGWVSIGGLVTAIMIILAPNVYAQSSPLTVQPSTGRVGVANTNPQYPLDVIGTVNVTGTVSATSFSGDGSQLTGLPSGGGSQWTTSGLNIYYNGGNVGVGNINPQFPLDVTGNVNVTGAVSATSFSGDGSQLTGLPSGGGAALDKVTANTSVTNTAPETTLYSFSTAGGTFSTNNMLRLTIQITDLDIVDGDTCVLRFKYGATTLGSITVSNSSAGAITNAKAFITFVIAADGATNAQLGTAQLYVSNSSLGIGSGLVQGTAVVDSTVAQTLSVTADWSVASTSNSITLGQAVLEKLS